VVTIKHIAKELGVSASTVARALADHPRISHETKARVRTAADRLGYVAHAAARVMRGQASTVVGLIVPDVQNEFYSTVARSISKCLDEAGFQMVLSITDDDPEVELRHVRGLFSARAAGAVVVASASPARETVSLLRRIPHVQLIRRCAALESDWFGIDDEGAMLEAARHLLSLGHRRIGLIGGSIELSTGIERLRGFQRAYREAGVPLELALNDNGGCDAEYGFAAAERLLARAPRPTALVTAGARITLGALQCLEQRRIAVPRDLSMVGFSDSPSFSWWGPGLTTVGLPVRDIAISCSALLLRRMRGAREERAAEPPCRALHAPYLIVRGSTAPPPA
jgi:LacI family transcriptional regulator